VLSQAARLPLQPSVVGFLAPTFEEGPITTRYGVRDEFGVPTSASTWADPALTWLAARQTGRVSGPNLKVLVVVGRGAKLVPGLPDIDMRDLRRLEDRGKSVVVGVLRHDAAVSGLGDPLSLLLVLQPVPR
jgi:hypothetical protein